MTVIRFDSVFPDGSPRKHRKVLVALVHGGAGASSGSVLRGDTVKVHLDASGAGSADLETNDVIDPSGTFYMCTLEGASPSVVRLIQIDGATPVNTSWADPSIQVFSPPPPESGGSGGGGGATVHNALTGRTASDAHPISAITGLTSALTGKEATGVAAAAVTAHAAATDPHGDRAFATAGDNALDARLDVVEAALPVKADLVGGVVPTSQLPTLAITDTFPVASQAAMLALTAQRGDVAVRTDISSTFILGAEPASTLGNWVLLQSPGGGGITSVNSQTGPTVVLAASDVGAVPTTRAVSAGTGLTGGGSLAADRSFAADFGTVVGKVTQGNDSRLSDTRTPTDATVTPAKFAAEAIDPVAGTAGARTLGTGGQQAAAGNDARLSNARTPTAHAASHAAAGSDPLTLTQAQVTSLVTDLAAKAPTARSIATTAPLAGGGDLSADRTLSIVAATASVPGSMSAADKAKLDAILGTNTGDQTTISGNAARTDALNSATTIINVAAATAPTSGQVLRATSATTATWQTLAGTGSVTDVTVTPANGVTGTVATSTTTPAISLTLGAITPSTVNGVTVSGASVPTLAVTGTSTISGANTGDQTTISGNAATVTTNANLTGPVTSTGNATAIASSINLPGAPTAATAAVSTNTTQIATTAFVLANAGGAVTSVNTRTGAVVLSAADVALGSVNNTADTAKPVSTAQQAALDLKANISSLGSLASLSTVTSAQITDGTIAAADIASDAVTTAKILDANVTTAKLADSAITSAKIADATIVAADMADAAVTAAKLGLNPLLGMDAGPLAFARWRSNGVRSVADGVTTSGSPTITSATANFTVADVGKTITAPGVTLNVVLVTPGTTITSVTNSTTAVMSANAAASTTATSFMFGKRPTRHIVCYGDSVTQAYGIDSGSPAVKRQSWVDDLRDRIAATGETVHGGWQSIYWNGSGRWASIAAGGWTSDGASASNLGPSGATVSALRRPNTTLGSLTWYRPGNMPVSEVTIWWVDDPSSGASFSWKMNATANTGTDWNTITCSAPGTPTLRQTVINLSSHPATFVENFSTIRIRNAAGGSATSLASPMILGISVRSSPTRTVTDGVTTNASVSITSATAGFTQADVGKLLGTTNVTVGTYIASVQSATQATLSANALATSSAQTFNLLSPITGIEVHNFGYSGESLATAIPKAGDWGAIFDALRPELAIIEFSNDCANATNLANFPARMDTVISRLAPYADLLAFGFPEQDPIGALRPVADQDTVRNSTITKILGGYRTVTDGVTATNTTITSATAAFVAADLGAWIGGPGIPQNTYITIVNSATNVTVSNATFATATALTMKIGRTGGSVNFKTRWGSSASAIALGLMEWSATPVHPNAEGDREIAATLTRFLRNMT